jgi:hypothetical protein
VVWSILFKGSILKLRDSNFNKEIFVNDGRELGLKKLTTNLHEVIRMDF